MTTTRGRCGQSRSMELWGLACFLAAVGSGCGSPPEVFFVEPNTVEAGQPNVVRIRGDGFEWDYNAFLDSATGTFEADVGDTPLEDVTWIEVTQLEGTLPSTVPPGLYDVTVRTSRGEGTLVDAILVRPAEP